MSFKKNIIILLISMLSACSTQSDFCNYVEVENESQFIGEWLKYSSAIKHETLNKQQCIYLDKNLDNSNGNKKGIVRWADCYAGPDCNEAGMF